MTIARSNLQQAITLGQQLDEVTAAIAAVNGGGAIMAIIVSDPTVTPTVARTISGLNFTPANLVTLLTARQTALQNALTALGVS